MASTQIHAVVSAPIETTAIETAHTVFETLCADGAVPIFNSYRLYTDDDTPYATEVTDETEDEIKSIWTGTIDLLKEKSTDTDGVYDPDRAARARLYRLYDADARPVLSLPHYSNLMNQSNLWHVPAVVKY